MDDNDAELPELLALTARLGVHHQVSLISRDGDGRAAGPRGLPPPGAGRRVEALRGRFAHLGTFPSYLEEIDRWLAGSPVASCRAGLQGFTIDPAGNVTACNEHLRDTAGNLAAEPWPQVRERLRALPAPRRCNGCYTLCRGVGNALGGGVLRTRWTELLRASGP